MDPIVPAPVQVTTEPDSWLVLTPGVRVVSDSDPAVLGVAVLAAGRLGVELDLTVAVSEAGADGHDADGEVVLRLQLVEEAVLRLPPGLSADVTRQAYRLLIADGRIDVRAASPLGLTHGVASLVRLAAAGTTRESRQAGLPPRLPCLEVLDHPWLPWRGVAVDLAAEPLGLDGLRVALGVMSALKLDVLHLPRVGAGRRPAFGALDRAEYAELRAAAESRHVRLLPGIDAVPDAGSAGELVAVTRARRVDVGGRYREAGAMVRAAREVLAAGAGVMAGQEAAGDLLDVARDGDLVLTVQDPDADLSDVRRAVALGARVVLCVAREAAGSPLVAAAAGTSRLLDVLDVPPHAVVGVEAVPASGSVGTRETGHGGGGAAGRLLPWMTAVAEVGWSPPAEPSATGQGSWP